MSSLKAIVKNGRLTLDEPTELEDGTVVELHPVVDDAMQPEDLAALDRVLQKSAQHEAQGNMRPLKDILEDVRNAR